MNKFKGEDGKYHFVYLVKNLISNKLYLGKHSTDNLNDGYIGSGVLINKAIKKYGKENFQREIIQFYNTSKEAYKLELLLSKSVDIVDNHLFYNLKFGGDGCGPGEENSFYGKHHSEETKQKISKANKGRKYEDIEFRKRLSNLRKKENLSEETLKKKSESILGCKNPFYNKHHSQETKDLISKSKIGKNLSEDHKNKIKLKSHFCNYSKCPKCDKNIGGGDYNFKRHIQVCNKNLK
jgi:group I intron endonuclease